jgi:membrane protease subunit HflC
VAAADRARQTHDGQNVIVGCFAVWRIEDPLLFYKRVRAERTAEEELRGRINGSRAKIIGQHNWSDFVNLDNELVDASYERIENEMLQDAAPGILKEYGVELRRVGIWRVSLPEEATTSVQDSMKQERMRMAARFSEEGEARKRTIVAQAQSQSDQILAFAMSKATDIEGAGVRAVQRVFDEIPEEDTEFFIWLRWLEALEAALATKTTFFMDSTSEIFQHFSTPPTKSMGGGN